MIPSISSTILAFPQMTRVTLAQPFGLKDATAPTQVIHMCKHTLEFLLIVNHLDIQLYDNLNNHH